jgi:hypothetical protein
MRKREISIQNKHTILFYDGRLKDSLEALRVGSLDNSILGYLVTVAVAVAVLNGRWM